MHDVYARHTGAIAGPVMAYVSKFAIHTLDGFLRILPELRMPLSEELLRSDGLRVLPRY